MMDDLNFNHNWNGKLNCEFFTTIRLWNEKKYFVGAKFRHLIKEKFKGHVEVVGVKKIYIHQINDWMAWMDTGYSAKTTQDIIRKMYKNRPTINWDSQQLAYVMLKRIKENIEPKLF